MHIRISQATYNDINNGSYYIRLEYSKLASTLGMIGVYPIMDLMISIKRWIVVKIIQQIW